MVRKRNNHIPGYDLFTHNMKKKCNAIYGINDVHADMEEVPDDELVDEYMWDSVELYMLLTQDAFIGGLTSQRRTMYKLIKRNAAQKEFTHQLITGAFNAKEICWETRIISSSYKIGQELLEYLGDASMTHKVGFYTRVREGQNPSLIDMVLVNEDGTECSQRTASWVELPCRGRI